MPDNSKKNANSIKQKPTNSEFAYRLLHFRKTIGRLMNKISDHIMYVILLTEWCSPFHYFKLFKGTFTTFARFDDDIFTMRPSAGGNWLWSVDPDTLRKQHNILIVWQFNCGVKKAGFVLRGNNWNYWIYPSSFKRGFRWVTKVCWNFSLIRKKLNTWTWINYSTINNIHPLASPLASVVISGVFRLQKNYLNANN